MTLHRFFVDPTEIAADTFAVPPSIAHQVHRVLRLGGGARVVLLPDDGTEVVCRLDVDRCVVEERRPAMGEPAHRLTVVQALLKGDALEEVVARATEVGVAAFRLAVTERCIVRELSSRKLERLRAIARESAEQSERGVVPGVHGPAPLDELLLPGAVMLFERAGAQSRLAELEPPAVVLIGPEGGFTPAEVERAGAAGLRIVGLGPRILRSQTVAPAVASVVLSRTGDFA
ncbi:MAG TPA: RsmE family RNA methyltransferase [Candidatus Angelobacter sp.]|nr:RsmE family RNA methyltransferase [Candidatus Angelobacter sp.]